MINHETMHSNFNNVNYKNIINKTTNSFSKQKKGRNSPLLTSMQCQSSDYELKYNKTNYRNKLERMINKCYSNTITNPYNNNGKISSHQNIKSVKHYNRNKDSFNSRTLDNTISKNTFIGKKISLSDHPLLIRNKFPNNNSKNKNLEINSSSINDKNSVDNHFSTKIERDLNLIINKNNKNEVYNARKYNNVIIKSQTVEPIIYYNNLPRI